MHIEICIIRNYISKESKTGEFLTRVLTKLHDITISFQIGNAGNLKKIP